MRDTGKSFFTKTRHVYDVVANQRIVKKLCLFTGNEHKYKSAHTKKYF